MSTTVNNYDKYDKMMRCTEDVGRRLYDLQSDCKMITRGKHYGHDQDESIGAVERTIEDLESLAKTLRKSIPTEEERVTIHDDVLAAIQSIDAAVFSSDTFCTAGNRAELGRYIARWLGELEALTLLVHQRDNTGAK